MEDKGRGVELTRMKSEFFDMNNSVKRTQKQSEKPDRGRERMTQVHTKATLTNPQHFPSPLVLSITLVCARESAHLIDCLSGAGSTGSEVSLFSDRRLLGDGCWYGELGVRLGPAEVDDRVYV